MYSKYIKNHKYPHNFNANGVEPTKNRMGGMHTLNEFSARFIEMSEKANKPVLDIGCAYGVATIPCLEKGADVIAIDIEQEHLNILLQRTPTHLHARLKTIQASFPDELDFADCSISSALMSRVFSFLQPKQLLDGLEKLFKWLEPGGTVIAINHTPYIKLFEPHIPEYEYRKSTQDSWPGYIENLNNHPKFEDYRMPSWINLMDKDLFTRIFSDAGFTINHIEYFSAGEITPIYDVQLDGRELVGCIATKGFKHEN